KALNRENEIGSLDIGKKADVLILDIPSVASIPYRFGINHTDTVFKDGKIIVKEGKKITN
ncbi:MAG: imidazolonepropionase, partial [Candidatus Heimdallarchaeota archaeon]